MEMPALRLFALFSLSFLVPAGARATCSTHPADVAPGVLGSEMPTPTWTITGDESIDIQDVLALLNGAVGNQLMAWAPPVGASCPAIPGNVSPGTQDDGFSPPRWTPTPDSALDVGDVLVALRMAVLLIELDPAWLEPIVTDAAIGDRVVAGSVIDSVSSSGLPAVTVTALLDDQDVGETETDAGGNFLLQGLPSGTLTLRLDGSGSTAGGKFSSLEVEIEVDTEATTSVQPLTLADETDPAGATGKFTGDETGTVDEEIALSSGDGDVGLGTGPGGKIEIDGEPADMEVDLSVVPIEGEDLPEGVTDDQSGEGLNSTGEVAVGPAEGKFTGGGAGLSGLGVDPGFDLTLPNRHDLPLGTIVDIWHWNGASWANCTAATGRSGEVVDLGGGMTAVFAAGVATEGGLYAAATPIDFFCTSSLSGFVTDDAGDPLAGVFVGTSLGASGFTDEFGNFYIPDLPAYSGADLGDCLAIGYEVFVRGGVELGGATGGVVVDEFDVFLGSETYVGEIQLTVPNEGCLSGLVLANGVGLAGPVTLTGPESLVLMAGAQGRFARTGLTPGMYRASFLFPDEALPREFEFEIVARLCTAVRLAINAGGGSQRLSVQVIYDHDGDEFTPNGPAAGALVRLVGADPVSALGLDAITGPGGRAVFENVTPPYDLVAVIERPLMDGSPGRVGGPDGYPFMRIGTGLMTTAPLGQASLLLRLPEGLEAPEIVANGNMLGTIDNLPALAAGEFLSVGSLRRNAFDEAWGGFADPMTGDYSTLALPESYDLAVAVRDQSFPNAVRELGFFGPFAYMPPGGGAPTIFEQDLDYAMSDRFVFDRVLPLTYTNFVVPASYKSWSVSGRRMDGRSFWTLRGLAEGADPFPSMMTVPDPASTDLDLLLEFQSEGLELGYDAQYCVVPLRSPLPAALDVEFVSDVDIYYPGAEAFLPAGALIDGPIRYDTTSSLHGFDVLAVETWFDQAGPGELAVASFRRFMAVSRDATVAIGPTPLPFVFPNSYAGVGLAAYRGAAFPSSHEEFFGPGLESRLSALSSQPDPICITAAASSFSILPDAP